MAGTNPEIQRTKREVARWHKLYHLNDTADVYERFATIIGPDFSFACVDFVCRLIVTSLNPEKVIGYFENARAQIISDQFAHYLGNRILASTGYLPYLAQYHEQQTGFGIPGHALEVSQAINGANAGFRAVQTRHCLEDGYVHNMDELGIKLDPELSKTWGALLVAAIRTVDFEDGVTFNRYEHYISPYLNRGTVKSSASQAK